MGGRVVGLGGVCQENQKAVKSHKKGDSCIFFLTRPSVGGGGGVLGVARHTRGVRQEDGGGVAGQHARLSGQVLLHRLVQAEETRVRVAVQELHLTRDALGDAGVDLLRGHLGRLRVVVADDVAPLVGERVDRLAVSPRAREDLGDGVVHRGEDGRVLLHAGTRGLGHEDAARVQLRLAHLVELLAVQPVARATLQRVVEVHDDDVVLDLRVLQLDLAVVVDQLQAGVLEGSVVLLQVLAAELHHLLVDVDHHALLHRLVAQHLAGRRALATAADEDVLRVRVRQERRVHQRLVVDVLVELRRLDEAVDDEDLAERRRVADVDLLELRLRRLQHLIDAVGEAQALLQVFDNPNVAHCAGGWGVAARINQ
eukprot:Rhum_TRINITY_DN15258_c6_g1::Rhum_TRINITY_DN15258_c6_g1_i1::g.148169::m.148169